MKEMVLILANKKRIVILLSAAILIAMLVNGMKQEVEVNTYAGVFGGGTAQLVKIESEPVVEVAEIEIAVDNLPDYNIPLSDDLQRYIWELCGEYELSYEMVLAVIYVESKFDAKAHSSTNDYGLMQIHGGHMDSHAANAGISNFDPFNPHQNVKVGIHLLATERNYFRSLGMGEEDVYKYSLGAYNRGRGGVKKYGIPKSYVRKVSAYKTKLDTMQN